VLLLLWHRRGRNNPLQWCLCQGVDLFLVSKKNFLQIAAPGGDLSFCLKKIFFGKLQVICCWSCFLKLSSNQPAECAVAVVAPQGEETTLRCTTMLLHQGGEFFWCPKNFFAKHCAWGTSFCWRRIFWKAMGCGSCIGQVFSFKKILSSNQPAERTVTAAPGGELFICSMKNF